MPLRKPRFSRPAADRLIVSFLIFLTLTWETLIARRFENRLLYCSQLGWLAWDGRRWMAGGAEPIRRRAEHETVRAIQDEASNAKQRGMIELGEKLAKWGRISESVNHMKAASDCAASMMAVSLEELDVDPMKFNVLNGTLHFCKRASGAYFELHPHSPKDLITRVAQVKFDPMATCETYDRFIHRVQPLDKVSGDTQRFLHQWAGLSMTGHTGEQKFTFHVGKGRNGKSVWVAAIANVMGDYATTISIESLLDTGRKGSGSQASPDIAMLRGIRFSLNVGTRQGRHIE
jgi:putative DNA primase/helicase